MGYANWTQAIQGWIEEKEHYFHGYPSVEVVGHYTQVHILSQRIVINLSFFLILDDLALSSIGGLCSYNVSSLWNIQYTLADVCL